MKDIIQEQTYKRGNHDLLVLISEIFINEEILNERMNSYNYNKEELSYYSNKIIDDITIVMEQIIDNKQCNNIIQNDENRININIIA